MNSEQGDAETILIVDDRPSNLQVLFAFLETQGFRILAAQNGENALNIAESSHPDLILLDILMPEMDGFEVCRRLKQRISTANIPVIFLTALSDTVNKIKGFELGGVDYVTKPIEQQELLARIQTHLTLKQISYRLKVQNQELQQEIYTRQQIQLQQDLVKKITEKIRDSLDETQILQTVTEELARVLQTHSCQIELYNPPQTKATIVYESSYILPKSQGVVREIADFPQLYQQLLDKIPLQFAEIVPEFSPRGLHCVRLACPIFESGDSQGILGNLWLLKGREEIFAEFEVSLVQQVASQCAIAIRQARLYEASVRQIQELEKLNRVKDDFLKTISHELRSSMSSIQLAVQTLEKLLQNEYSQLKSVTFTRVLNIFRQASQRHNKLVEDLLTLCYLDAKADAIVLEPIYLQTWIPEIIQPFFERTQYQHQQLNIDIPADLPLLNTDISTLERIIIELLNNACKYTPAGETIAVKVRNCNGQVEISTINSGVVIPKEEQKRVFDQFYRIPNNDPWKYGGTGLGLTLVKKMVNVLHGTIELESGQNTTKFTIQIPYF